MKLRACAFRRKVRFCFDGKDNRMHSATAFRTARQPVTMRLLPTTNGTTPPSHAPAPLLRFIRALTKEQREEVAATCGTTVHYLYQLAAEKHPNPRVRLAMSLCAESRRLSRKVHSPPLTLDDLLVGQADPDPGQH